jgi:hypothetical protein
MWRSRHLGFGFLILDWHRRNKSNFMIMGSSEHVQAIVLIFCRLSSLGIFPLLRMFSERNKCFLWALFAVCYCLARCFHLDPQNLGVRMGDAYWTRVTIFLACSQKKQENFYLNTMLLSSSDHHRGMYPKIQSGIHLTYILTFYLSIWHIFWASAWHSISHFVWHPFWLSVSKYFEIWFGIISWTFSCT